MKFEEKVIDPETGKLLCVRMNREAWNAVHRDFKSGRLGKDATVLTGDPKGGSCLVPVELVK